ncbi:ATP-binding cassette domain-containing protein [Mycoplasma sp. 5912]
MEKHAIEFIDICKSFGEIKANQNISFKVKKGTIHALIGENGAGKSTLMSILFGLYEPDKGIIKVNDKEVSIDGPNEANRLGIGMVHQHFKLVDVYTNLENIVLGSEDNNKHTRIIDFKPAIKKIKAIQESFNLYFDLNKVTGAETVATQQKVEIMKMLYRDSDILIFDEPTAVLTDQEIQGLLETFKLFRSQGKTILFISHKLGEIKEVSDNATVLRLGKVTGDFAVKDASIEEMASRMVGGDVEITRNEYSDTTKNPVVLSIQNVSTQGDKPLKNVSLDVKSGEILAIAGVEGNGQLDLEYVVSGMKKPISGDILLAQTQLSQKRVKEIARANKFKNIGLFVLSLLMLIVGIVLIAVPKQVSEQFTFRILGGIFIFGFVLLLGIFFKLILGIQIKHVINKFRLNGLNKMKLPFQKLATWSFSSMIIMFLFTLIFVGLLFKYKTVALIVLLMISIICFVAFGLIVLHSFWYSTIYGKFKNKKHELLSSHLIGLLSLIALIDFVFSLIIRSSTLLVFQSLVIVFSSIFLIGLLIYMFFVFKQNQAKFMIKKDTTENISLTDYGVKNISRLGVTFIPSDRHKHGLVLDYNIKNNTILRRLWDSEYVRFGILRDAKIKKENNLITTKYDVRGTRGGLSQARQLSGGNQQKFIVGREMNTPHDFILIVQPTRGLDVGAIKNIHEQILLEKKNGKAILLISYELDEVLALADKIAVINSGEILAVKQAQDLTRTEIGIYMAHKKEGGVNV